MARASKRNDVLEAVATLVEGGGLTAITLDAVAAEIGMTRAGLLYHFPSREALIRATHEHLAAQWEQELVASAGKAAAEASEAERYAAYVNVSAEIARRGELLLMLESYENKELGDLWQDVIDRWAPPFPVPGDHAEMRRFVARLAADGLWVHEAFSSRPVSRELRRDVIACLADLLDDDA